jgi:RimJ/RimL family protein N-acetyltransferase
MSSVPHRIVTERLVLRPWEIADAPAMKRVIDANIPHLLPWMPWASQEPETVAEKAARIRSFQGLFERDEDWVFGIFDKADGEPLGGTGFHPRVGPEAREIGYWISGDREGQGLVSESTAALTRVGFELLALDRMEIHCDPANLRSAAVPKRLGYELEATLKRRIRNGYGELTDSMIWTLFASGYPASPSSKATLEAFDENGDRVL